MHTHRRSLIQTVPPKNVDKIIQHFDGDLYALILIFHSSTQRIHIRTGMAWLACNPMIHGADTTGVPGRHAPWRANIINANNDTLLWRALMPGMLG